MRIFVIATIVLCWLFSVVTGAEARSRHGGRLPWCGIYMGQYFGKSDRSLWVARNWAREGSAVSGPGEGVVVVWPHHVGVIVGRSPSGEWLVHSGNDGNAVRTRPRSLRGAIAFRQVGSGSVSAYVDLKRQEETVRRRDKHLVALAIESGHATQATHLSLKQPRAAANVASVGFSSFGYASAFAPPTDRADEVFGQQRKPVVKGKRVLVAFGAPVSQAVNSSHGEQFSIFNHDEPRTRHERAAAGHPSSRALLR